jgi:hypothetical protein
MIFFLFQMCWTEYQFALQAKHDEASVDQEITARN